MNKVKDMLDKYDLMPTLEGFVTLSVLGVSVYKIEMSNGRTYFTITPIKDWGRHGLNRGDTFCVPDVYSYSEGFIDELIINPQYIVTFNEIGRFY